MSLAQSHCLPVRCHVVSRLSKKTNIFTAVLGESFENLPAAVQWLHTAPSGASFRGNAEVKVGNLLARLLGRLARFPQRPGKIPLTVTIIRTDDGERWERVFADSKMVSDLKLQGAYISEKLGLMDLRFELQVAHEKLVWKLVSVRCLGLPIPHRWFDVFAEEYGDDTCYRFDVSCSLPIVGLLIAYKGSLYPNV